MSTLEPERECRIHFCVPCAPGEAGLVSNQVKNVASLPPVLAAGLNGTAGRRYRFACSVNKMPNAYNVMSGMAYTVTCPKCRASKAWLDAPDDGPYPKDPIKGFAEDDDTDE